MKTISGYHRRYQIIEMIPWSKRYYYLKKHIFFGCCLYCIFSKELWSFDLYSYFVPVTMCVRSVMHFPFSICIMSFNRKHSWVPANWSNFAVLLLVACTQEWRASSFSPSPAPFDLSQDTPPACLLLNAIQRPLKIQCISFFCTSQSIDTVWNLWKYKWRGFLLRHCHQNNFFEMFLKFTWVLRLKELLPSL